MSEHNPRTQPLTAEPRCSEDASDSGLIVTPRLTVDSRVTESDDARAPDTLPAGTVAPEGFARRLEAATEPTPSAASTRTQVQPKEPQSPPSRVDPSSIPPATPKRSGAPQTQAANSSSGVWSARMLLALVAAFLVPFVTATWWGGSLYSDSPDSRPPVPPPPPAVAHSAVLPDSTHGETTRQQALRPAPPTRPEAPPSRTQAASEKPNPLSKRSVVTTKKELAATTGSRSVARAQESSDAPSTRSEARTPRETKRPSTDAESEPPFETTPPRAIAPQPPSTSFRVAIPEDGPAQRNDHKVEISD